jgi:hypothetical protein
MDDVGPAYRWGVRLLIVALIAWVMVDCARGQYIKAEGEGGVMAWASDSHSYQHAMHARAKLTATWEPVVARAKLALKRWGASDAILRHAMLNAETGKVYSRRQGASIGIRWRFVEVGAEYDRRSVHHVWRHKGRKPRHDHFPGSWDIGRSGNAPSWDRNPIYPSLGYWDGIRPYVRVEHGRFRLVLRGPLYHWKTLTLPWPGLRARAGYEWSNWRAAIDVQGLRHRALTGRLEIERHVTGPLWVRGSAGWVHPPQWQDERLRRLAFGLIITQ